MTLRSTPSVLANTPTVYTVVDTLPPTLHATLLADRKQVMLEVIVKRLQEPAPMPRHLLQTLSRLGYNDRRCSWYYNNYGRSGSSSYEAVAAAGDGVRPNVAAADFVVAEPKPEWDQTYVQAPRGSIRSGFQSVSTNNSPVRPTVHMAGVLLSAIPNFL